MLTTIISYASYQLTDGAPFPFSTPVLYMTLTRRGAQGSCACVPCRIDTILPFGFIGQTSPVRGWINLLLLFCVILFIFSNIVLAVGICPLGGLSFFYTKLYVVCALG